MNGHFDSSIITKDQKRQIRLGGKCLGNVRTEQIKRTAKELIQRYPDKFSNDFKKNKQIVNALIQGGTTKIRNQIAGYITHSFAVEQAETPDENLEEG